MAEIERLCAEGDGATLKDIHACLGSAHSTIFRNVEALVEAGFVVGRTSRPIGQRYGKPRNLYRLTVEGFTELRVTE
ncbi:winged helix-turn-helix domain-containing protein, partial [Lacticaseibacillus rhamnosus]|uniref:winged helix-turn-helix domain-containing protein n=1 Tax=Lacticaseibacillus rhamnosus TaxID=47715 RepID=UPI003F4576AF